MDATFWLLLGAIVGFSCAFFGVGVYGIRKIRAIQGQIDQARSQVQSVAQVGMDQLKAKVIAWAFTETLGEIDDPANPGTKKQVRIRTPSAEFKGMVGLLVPEFIGQAVEYGKKNVKMSDVVSIAGGGGGLAGAIDPKMLKEIGIPKEYRGLLQLGFQFKDQILGFLKPKGGSSLSQSTGGGDSTKYSNPFLGK